jgi:PTH1 family peptidyl-tRNA hydrolase
MKLVVGLGNPGRKYQPTRHNAGFWWVERLADRARASLRMEGKFQGHVGKLAPPDGEAWLLLPETFMNHSGRAVAALAGFYKIAPAEILVVHDELDLPPGTARLKKGGGTGGHNGVTDVAAQLGTKDFWRLRIGIGHPGVRDEVIDYVLKPPRAEEAGLIDESIDTSLALWPMIADGRLEAAMHKLHTKAAQKPATAGAGDSPPGPAAGTKP